jgi:NADH-quinone oxidoreductase subunit A
MIRMQYNFLPIFLLVACMIGLAVVLLLLSAALNPGRSSRVTRMPYENGMDPIHDNRRRFDVRFHLVAIAFLVFDVELLFLYPWAVASRPAMTAAMATEQQIGTDVPPNNIGIDEALASKSQIHEPPTAVRAAGIDNAVAKGDVGSRDIVFGGVMTFFALLALGFAYDWRKGVFRWR